MRLLREVLVVLLTTLAACIYGIVHDQITIRLSLEYFTVAHPPLFGTHSPALLALYWGIAATVGIGALLGFVLARVSQAGGTRPLPLSRVMRSILFLLLVMAGSAAAAGVLGYWIARFELIHLPTRLAVAIPA